MVEKFVREIETIETPHLRQETHLQAQNKHKEYKSKAKSPEGVLKGLILKFNADIKLGIGSYTPQELRILMSEALNRLNGVKSIARVNLKGWKGKSSLNIIEHPDYFEVRTFQKPSPDEEPIEQSHRINKYEINRVIVAINSFDKGEIKTEEIAGRYCELSEIRYNNEGKPLFPEGRFDWQPFFADRHLHCSLNLCLRLLQNYGVISYKNGSTSVLKQVMDIQMALR